MSEVKADEKVQSVVIDGHAVPFYRGESVIQAAIRQQITIPHYCWHPRLSVAANCRMCLVELEKAPKLVPACQTECKDGMVVHTANEKVKVAQRQVHEFLLVNHPIDCPICDQAGECKLQDYYMRYQLTPSRMRETKSHKPKSVRLGPLVVYNAQRCIMCTRCVRFMEEVPKSRQLGILGRGDHSVIGTTDGRPLDNPYSLNTVDVCPVGALTSTAFRFKQRVWNLRRSPSICPGCSKGCNVQVDQRSAQVYRLQPRENEQVNKSWLCDQGRLTYSRANEGRQSEALVRDGEFLRPISGAAAAESAFELLGRAPNGKGLVVALSLHATNESTWALCEWLTRAAPEAELYLTGYAPGQKDNLLRMADQNPNRHGIERVLGVAKRKAFDGEKLAKALGKSGTKLLLAIGHEADGLDEVAGAAKDAQIPVITIAFARSALSDIAQVQLPSISWVEEDGTWVSGEERVQRLIPAFVPQGEAQALPQWLGTLARHAGAEVPTSKAGIQARLSAEGGAFANLPLGELSMLGVLLERETLAASA